MRRHTLSIAIALAATIMFAGSSSAFAVATAHSLTPTQLPRNIRPSHYAIAITPNASEASFTGQVTISIEVLKPTNSITLNASDLAFQSVTLTGDQTSFKAENIKVDEAQQTATFTFLKPIAKGTYQLAIAYTGVIGSQANGLFHVDYDTPAGHQRALYTQFENSDARRFVPSWDEPNYKATFDLQATVPSNQMAVSNMPSVSSTDLHDGRSLVKFGTSPNMSTYLLFFGLGDFERATDKVDGTEVGVITQRGSLSQAAFPLASSTQILHEYNDYFGVRFPLPKLDNIAAPGSSQFFSAMENWGAIFTFENAMLLDPTISTQNDKEISFITEAHEMAHQWFGDLVTMRWWDDLWLNEGFASWMENRTTARLHPEWNTKLATVDVHNSAMGLDSLSTTHPIVQHIETVEQASQAFDQITYQKGESVIHMLESYVGENAWRDGVRAYMKQHAYSNTTSDDFWGAIQAASPKPILAIAHDFTLQPGIPMIKVSEASCVNGTSTVQLTQSEFSRDHMNKKSLSWHVPVTAQVIGATEPAQVLVSGGKATMHLTGCGPLVVNAGQTGYFRTLYAPKQFSALADHFAELAPIDQLGLLSDSWSLGQAGLQPMSDALNLAVATPLNSDPQVWSNVTALYSGINHLYRNDAARQQRFNKFAVAQLSPVMAKTGWNGSAEDTSATINLREQLIQTLSELDDPVTIAEAKRRYDAQGTDPAAFPVALRKVIMSVVALHADPATWDKMHAAAQTEKSPMIKDQLYHLISTSKNPELANRALNMALTDEPGATNSAGMLDQVARMYPDTAFDFSIAHLAQVDKFVDGTSRSRYLPLLAAGSSDPAMVGKLNAYAKAHLAASALGSTKTAIANINYHVKVRTQRLPEIDAWLAKHQ
ncbi:aminopeptidase N [Oxalobacteraceae bacterium GrIS 2.11]